MTAISATSTLAAAAPVRSVGANAAPIEGDLLGAMRPAMDTASQVGRPVDAAGAAEVLGTGASYLQGASATIAKLDEGIAKRRTELDRLRTSDPEAAQDKQRQLELLERLRERIQLSIERVSDILAGTHRDDIGSDPMGTHTHPRGSSTAQVDSLEQRRRMLAPSMADATAPTTPTAVAGAYASAAAWRAS